MLRKILIGLVAALALLVVLILTRPSTYAVERSLAMAAPPAIVYGLVSDFHQWDSWSPWSKLDPKQVTTYGGPASGVGATYAWVGNDQVGEGKMTITDARPGELVGIKLEFLKPFASTARTEFVVAPDGAGTRMTWKMAGENDLMGKAMSLVTTMDQLIGKDFEKGLAQLRPLAEEAARKAAPQADATPPTEGTGKP